MGGIKQALIKTTEKDFFKHWLILTKPLHKLNSLEINITSLLLYYFFQFKKEMDKDHLAWKLTFDYEIKSKIVKELKINDQMFRNTLTILRKSNVITNNQIAPSFVPKINLKESNSFSLIFKFEIND